MLNSYEQMSVINDNVFPSFSRSMRTARIVDCRLEFAQFILRNIAFNYIDLDFEVVGLYKDLEYFDFDDAASNSLFNEVKAR